MACHGVQIGPELRVEIMAGRQCVAMAFLHLVVDDDDAATHSAFC